MVLIPDGWCSTCHQKALTKIDLAQEDTETLAKLKRMIPVAGALGGRDSALAEVCFHLDLPVPPDMQRQTLDEASAKILLAEIMRRFGHLVVNAIMNAERFAREVYERMRHYEDRDRQRRREMEEMEEMMRYRDYARPPVAPTMAVDFGRELREKHYYIPEYRVKENKRGPY